MTGNRARKFTLEHSFFRDIDDIFRHPEEFVLIDELVPNIGATSDAPVDANSASTHRPDPRARMIVVPPPLISNGRRES